MIYLVYIYFLFNSFTAGRFFESDSPKNSWEPIVSFLLMFLFAIPLFILSFLWYGIFKRPLDNLLFFYNLNFTDKFKNMKSEDWFTYSDWKDDWQFKLIQKKYNDK